MNWRILHDPLAVFGKSRGMIAAFLAVAVLGAVALWGGVHLDGALDIHITPNPPTVLMIVLESLLAWISLGALLFASSKAFKGNGGFWMHLAAAGLGRFPFIFAAIITSRHCLGRAMLRAVTPSDGAVIIRPDEFITPGLIIGTLVLIGMLAWAIVVLLSGFKQASKLTGGRATAAFVAGILAAELVSKLILWLI